ncbi:hypothetical protein D1831_10110 [Lactiplantibacillus garii]|uniref:Uncharacterized protein n=1 Tax=Lactiplantibacillus garii TaxID=2306423 RepID=A0A426D5J7_9LACO|nr:hypothetical protein [Lactiplantibacillus garii]RRK09903.1 hypothetical protein D1831_10110 [Lactiplantibacillus garii]
MHLKMHVDRSRYPRWYHRFDKIRRVVEGASFIVVVATCIFWHAWQLWLLDGLLLAMTMVMTGIQLAEDVHVYRLGQRRYK